MNKFRKLAILSAAIALGVFPASAAPQSHSGIITAPNSQAIIMADRASHLIGQTLKNSEGLTIGKLDNIVMDLEGGRVLYAVVNVSGLSGDNRVAIPPGKFVAGLGGALILNVEKAQLTDAPRFTKERMVEPASSSFMHDIYSHFDQRSWWVGGIAPTSRETFGNVCTAEQLLNVSVRTPSNEYLGKVKNVVIDLPAGRVMYVAFVPAGKLISSDNVYLVPPSAFVKGADLKTLNTTLDRARLEGAPHFNEKQWPNVADITYGNQVYQYYGKQPYFH